MSAIAVIGSGRVGKTLATKLAATGHTVTIGSRNPSDTAAALDGDAIAVATVGDAIAGAEVVINATPGETAIERLSALREELDGKVLVDVANATRRGEDGGPGGLVYPNESLGQKLQEALPDTRVVKTLNTMLFPVMVNPGMLQAPPTAFVSGDDDDAKGTVTALLADLGWPEGQIVDLGGIATARGPEALILLVPDVLAARGMVPFAIGLIT